MHEPTALENVNRFNKKQGRSLGGRRWNVWYKQLRCPTCGRTFTLPENPFKGRQVRCVGKDQLQVRKKD